MDDDNVRDTGHNAERLKYCGLNGRSPTASGIVERKYPWRAAPGEMLEYNLLQFLFGAATGHDSSQKNGAAFAPRQLTSQLLRGHSRDRVPHIGDADPAYRLCLFLLGCGLPVERNRLRRCEQLSFLEPATLQFLTKLNIGDFESLD